MGGTCVDPFYAVAWHLRSLSQPRGGCFFNFLRRGDMTIESENDELESVSGSDFVARGRFRENWKSVELENWTI